MESLSDIAAEYEFSAAQRVVARVNRSACDTPAVDVGEHCPQVIDGPMVGDGFGKPMGILNPAAGIPICETAPSTPPGVFSWQDLVALRWQVPANFQDGGAYIMNQNTWALCYRVAPVIASGSSP